MYKINIWFYTRYFDFIIFNKDWILKKFGKDNIYNKNLHISKDYIFWFTEFLWLKIFNIFNLSNFDSIYRIVADLNCFSFYFKWQYFFVLVYITLDNEFWFYTDCKENDINIDITNKNIIIENKVLETVLLTEDLNLSFIRSLQTSDNNKQYIDIIDFYYFDNLFKPNEDIKLLEDLKKLDNFTIYNKWTKTNWKIYIENWINELIYCVKIFSNIVKPDLSWLKKFFLSINPNQYLLYTYDKDFLTNQLKVFLSINNINYKKIKIDFETPQHINNYDNDFLFFQQNICMLRYILYDLKKNLYYINNTENNNNIFFQLSKERLKIKWNMIEKYIKIYEEKLYKLKNIIQVFLQTKK